MVLSDLLQGCSNKFGTVVDKLLEQHCYDSVAGLLQPVRFLGMDRN